MTVRKGAFADTPQPTVHTLVLEFLTDHEREEILEHGRPLRTDSMRASSGPLRPHVSMRSNGLHVTQHAPEAWAVRVAWHTYCREYGYPTGERCEAPGYPPCPTDFTEREVVRVTWGQVRAWLRAETEPEQLSLLGAAA